MYTFLSKFCQIFVLFKRGGKGIKPIIDFHKKLALCPAQNALSQLLLYRGPRWGGVGTNKANQVKLENGPNWHNCDMGMALGFKNLNGACLG